MNIEKIFRILLFWQNASHAKNLIIIHFSANVYLKRQGNKWLYESEYHIG